MASRHSTRAGAGSFGGTDTRVQGAPLLDVGDLDNHLRQGGSPRVDLDAEAVPGADAGRRRRSRSSQIRDRLQHLPLDPHQRLEGHVEDVCRAAGRIQDSQTGEPRVEVPEPSERRRQSRHPLTDSVVRPVRQLLDLGLHLSPSLKDWLRDRWRDEPLYIPPGRVFRPSAVTLGRMERPGEEHAEDRRLDYAEQSAAATRRNASSSSGGKVTTKQASPSLGIPRH
jgi:hypothetical protein